MTHSKCLPSLCLLAPDWSDAVTSGMVIGQSLRASSLHISLLFPSGPDAGRCIGGITILQSEGWSVTQWPIRDPESQMSQSDQWSQLWSPNMGHLWAHRANECGMSHGVIDMARAKASLEVLRQILLLLSPRHSLHFSSSCGLFRLAPTLASWDLWCVLMSGCLGRWGNENGLCDIQSDKNMDFWKMKYETAHRASGQLQLN